MDSLTSLPEEILNTLPIAISVQTPERDVLFENAHMRELFGDFSGRKCYGRWTYLHGDDFICTDCPGKAVQIDIETHTILRKTRDRLGNEIYLKISHYPIKDKKNNLLRFIEVVADVTVETKKRLIDLQDQVLINFDDIHLSLLRFGSFGGELVSQTADNILSDEEKRIKVTAFWLTSIGQGHNFIKGFFGPLPFLDQLDYISYTYSFRIAASNLDPRMKGREIMLLIIATNQQNDSLFSERELIADFFEDQFSKYDCLEDIESSITAKLKEDLIDFLKQLNSDLL